MSAASGKSSKYLKSSLKFLCARPAVSSKTGVKDPKKQSSKVSRIFRRSHAHGLIAKIPRNRRWKVTLYGRRIMGTALYLRDSDFPRAYPARAA